MTTQSTSNTDKNQAASDQISIKTIVTLCLYRWKWFAITIPLSLILALFYILKTPPTYERSATVMIKEDSGNGLGGGLMGSLSAFGLGQSSAVVNNEVVAFESPTLLMDVIQRLKLEVSYTTKVGLRKVKLYDTNQPIVVTFRDIDNDTNAKFDLDMLEGNQVELSNFKWGKKGKSKEVVAGVIGSTITTPLGAVTILPNPNYLPQTEEVAHMVVQKIPLYTVTDGYSKNINIKLDDDIMSSIIYLSVKNPSIQCAEDILNTLIDVYNERWVADKNLLANSTSKFIEERLAVISKELAEVDSKISEFQSENKLPDIEAAAKLYLEKASKTDEEILLLNNQLYMTTYMLEHLQAPTSLNELLPANSGIDNRSIEQQISAYNEMQLDRNSIIASSSDKNPLVRELDESLASLRKSVVVSLTNFKTTLTAQIDDYRKLEQETMSSLSDSPTQAKFLLTEGRQQKVKEALYLFLLEKREENELSQAFTAYNTRIISPPYGKLQPIAPVKKIVACAALLIGILLPLGLILINKLFDTNISSREDLQTLSYPFMGEIPFVGKSKNSLLAKLKLREKRDLDTRPIVVKEDGLDIENESFRMLRTNLEFWMNSNNTKRDNVILLTSALPGSGKTFITMNLGISFALKGKRVLILDSDLRIGAQSRYVNSPKRGSVNYLSGQTDDYDSLIVKGTHHPNLDLLPIGSIPPNPAELLTNGRYKQLIDVLRIKYDYVLIDTPPLDVVTDTAVIGQYVDRSIFVVRANLFPRTMIPALEKVGQEGRLKNISVILNGTDKHHRSTKYYGAYYKS